MALYNGNGSSSVTEKAKKSSGKGELVRAKLEFGDSAKKKNLSVQFNPQDISINNSLGSDDNVFETPEGTKFTIPGRTTSSDMSVELFFDADNAISAVTAVEDNVKPKEPPSSQGSKSITSGVTSEFPDAGKNLIDILNFFDDIILSDDYHQVTFAWGKFYFMGNINSIGISVILFDKYGSPKRAKVTISIERKIEAEKTPEGPKENIVAVEDSNSGESKISDVIS